MLDNIAISYVAVSFDWHGVSCTTLRMRHHSSPMTLGRRYQPLRSPC